jgi:hypothetical protein
MTTDLTSPNENNLVIATNKQSRVRSNAARSAIDIRKFFILNRMLRQNMTNISKGKRNAHNPEMFGMNQPK